MQMRARLEALFDEMLDGRIMLDEALAEFEKLYIQKALIRHKAHLSRTAATLGIHRNTLSKRVADCSQETQQRQINEAQGSLIHTHQLIFSATCPELLSFLVFRSESESRPLIFSARRLTTLARPPYS